MHLFRSKIDSDMTLSARKTKGGIMNFKYALCLLITLFSLNTFAEREFCELRTSTTTLDRYDVKKLLGERSILICVDNAKFDRYDLKDFLNLKAKLRIEPDKAATLDRYDIKDFARLGDISLILGEQTKFDRYDVKDFLALKVSIVFNSEISKFDRYDFKDFLRLGHITLFLKSSATRFDRYDIVDFGKAAKEGEASRVFLTIDNTKFDQYDIKNFKDAGVFVLQK